MSSELKPCPFCGGEATLRKMLDGRYAVYCDNLDCPMQVRTCDRVFTLDEAITAWNQRAERTCKNKSRTALRFVCSRCGESATVYCEEDFGDVVNHSSIINYCPSCGAKVVM